MADVSQIKLPNGSVYDLIDEKSGYITAQYIEDKTDYSIPVSRVGEIEVGETVIGTDSTNFPTSKAVVDYVDERVVQEIDVIDVGVTGIKANGTSLSITNGVVNIPVIGPNQSVGLITQDVLDTFANYIQSSIPTSTSQLTNDSGFITSETDPVFSTSAAAGITSTDISNWNNKSDTDEKLKLESINENVSYHPILTTGNMISTASTKFTDLYGISYSGGNGISGLTLGNNTSTTESTGRQGRLTLYGAGTFFSRFLVGTLTANSILTLPNKTGTIALTSDIPKVYSSTNTGGYLTMATLPIYDGTVV